jgi:hypothetical protein
VEFKPDTADDLHMRRPDISLKQGLPRMVSDFQKRTHGIRVSGRLRGDGQWVRRQRWIGWSRRLLVKDAAGESAVRQSKREQQVERRFEC